MIIITSSFRAALSADHLLWPPAQFAALPGQTAWLLLLFFLGAALNVIPRARRPVLLSWPRLPTALGDHYLGLGPYFLGRR